MVGRISRPRCLCPNPQSTMNVRVCGKGELKVAHQLTSQGSDREYPPWPRVVTKEPFGTRVRGRHELGRSEWLL